MPFPYCQFAVGHPRRRRPCRAVPTFVVADTVMRGSPSYPLDTQGWFELGDFCTGHAITVAAAIPTRAMRPLPATVEVHGK